jgi:hypothetical protein
MELAVNGQSNAKAEQAIAQLRDERAQTLRTLLTIPDELCSTRVEWWGRQQTINQRLRAFTGHADDHFQHLHRLLEARRHHFSEAQLLMMKAHAALAEFEVLVLSLDDQEFDATGPNEEDWSARQVLEHVINNERKYRENILSGIDGTAAASNAPVDLDQ